MDTGDKLAQLEQLIVDVNKYFNLRFDALRLRAVEHLSTLFSLIFSTLVGIFLLMLAFLFIMSGVTVWLGNLIGSLIGAMFITGGFFLIIAIIVIIFRKKIITNRMVRVFIKMFFDYDTPDKNWTVRNRNEDYENDNDYE
jgi:VIT1/CCC1 family predicted Fe2+/Mn2+ transporter